MDDITPKEAVRAVRQGLMSRRQFSMMLTAAGVGMATMPLSTTVGHASSEHPMVFTWAGYDDDGFNVKYREKYGSAPNYSFFGDEEEALAKIRAGFTTDISMPCSYKIPLWHSLGILEPIDTSRLSNWDDIIPNLKNVEGTSFDGKPYWVCQDWAQTSIIYREDLVDINEESWGLMWDERYAGRLAMVDSLIDGVMVAAIYGDAKDPFNMTDTEVATTQDLLRKQQPLLAYYSNSQADVEQALASGELVAAVGWNSSYGNLSAEGVPVKWAQPKEGAMTWTCGLCLQTGVEESKLDRAYDFIDAMLSPEAGEYEITEWYYGHSNMKAFDRVSAEDLAARGFPSDPSKFEEFLNAGIFQVPIANEPVLQEIFDEVKAGF
jgi:spermidine/putrescine transport system substrate-binding protein